MGQVGKVARRGGDERGEEQARRPPEARTPQHTVLALQRSAGNRAVARALLQRAWSDDHVYTVIRERIPGFQDRLRPETFAIDVRERFDALDALTGEIEKEIRDSVGGRYRLGRTEEYAETAVETLKALQARAAAARDAARAMAEPFWEADKRVAELERVSALLQAVTQERHVAGASGAGKAPDLSGAEKTLETQAVIPSDTFKGMDVTFAALDKWALEQRALIDAAKAPLIEYFDLKLELEGNLEQIDELFAQFATAPVKGRKQMQTAREGFTPRMESIVKRGEAARGLTTKDDVGALTLAVKQLKDLRKDVRELGVGLEDATDGLTSGPSLRRGQRTSLPTVTATVAAGVPHRAQMLVAAVKDTKKSPAWMTAAEDFTRNTLATGRPDHIHICGGGNTLLYSGRLLLGFISVHLDSSQPSQRQANKVFGRDRSNPVDVVLQGGVLKEVVPG
jgi:hypothetical protein